MQDGGMPNNKLGDSLRMPSTILVTGVSDGGVNSSNATHKCELTVRPKSMHGSKLQLINSNWP